MREKIGRKYLVILSIRIILTSIVLLIALFGNRLAIHDPYKTELGSALIPPGSEYLCGTDNLGRCVMCRILAGASTSVFSALSVVVIVFIAGGIIGIVAGYAGGVIDEILMKITVVFQAFPSFILAICVAAMLGTGLRNGILSLSLVYWTTYARLGRSLVLSMKNETYIKAARMCGAGPLAIVIHYVTPNVIAPVIVTAALDVGNIILSMAGLSFLGLGAERPTAEWGAMMSETRNYLQTGPWGILFPGIALFVW